MQKGRVLNLSKLQVLAFLKNNTYSLICFLFMVLGVILALVTFNKFEFVTAGLNTFFKSFIVFRQNNTFLKIVIFSFLKSFIMFLGLFCLGTSIFGVVTVPLTVSFCGYFYGAAVAYLYNSFALKGVAFNALIFLPSSLVVIIFIIFASRLSIKFSLDMAKLTLPNSFQGDLFLQFKEYSIKYLLLSLGLVLSALLDGITAVSMLKFFEF